MKRIRHLTVAISLALLIAVPVERVLPDDPATDANVPERHHLLYGSVIPNPTDDPISGSDCIVAVLHGNGNRN